jgi:hypothetical protein
MRYVTIPADVRVFDPKTEKEEFFSFKKYATLIWLDDVRWLTPKTRLANLLRVLSEFDKEPNDVASLEDADWDILKKIIEEPGTGPSGPILLRPTIQVQVGPPFEKAVLEAATSIPATVQITTTERTSHGKQSSTCHDPSYCR